MTRTTVIDRFSGSYAFLSNFAPSVVQYDGVEYRTTEHAFQAAKTENEKAREDIRNAATPGQAKRLGRLCVLRDGWNEMRVEVMRALLKQKFGLHSGCVMAFDGTCHECRCGVDIQDREPYKSALLATGDAQLIEGNTWNDTFWGVCRGEGENHLGKLLMNIRDALKRRS